MTIFHVLKCPVLAGPMPYEMWHSFPEEVLGRWNEQLNKPRDSLPVEDYYEYRRQTITKFLLEYEGDL